MLLINGFITIVVVHLTITGISSQEVEGQSKEPLSSLRISERKCLEYSDLIPENVRRLNCDISVPHIVSIGGEDALPKEFPHMALLGYDNEPDTVWGCGGTLLSDRYILTAAHCLNSREYGPVKTVRLGELILDTDTDEAQPIDIPVNKIINHPDRDLTNYNDIGLVRLDEPVTFNQFIRPACLPTEFRISAAKGMATGWGQTDWSSSLSSKQLKVILSFLPHQQCVDEYSVPNRRLPDGIRESTQLCAGSDDRDIVKDTCRGDSGGPIQTYHSNFTCMHTIVGITSFGKLCGAGPSVYTRVYPYLDWIEQTVWPGQ